MGQLWQQARFTESYILISFASRGLYTNLYSVILPARNFLLCFWKKNKILFWPENKSLMITATVNTETECTFIWRGWGDFCSPFTCYKKKIIIKDTVNSTTFSWWILYFWKKKVKQDIFTHDTAWDVKPTTFE